MQADKVLENILYGRVHSVDSFLQVLVLIAAKIIESENAYRLLIIDSIMGLFRVDFSGRGELSERQCTLGKALSRITKIAEQFNIAVYMTNQVMSDPSGAMTGADPRKPIGGNILGHMSTTRIYMKKGKGEMRICKIVDSPLVAEKDAQVLLVIQALFA